MDLQTARKTAQKQSKEKNLLLYINLDGNMDCVISEKADANNENVIAAFNKGIEVPISDEPKTTKTNAALAGRKSNESELQTKKNLVMKVDKKEKAEKKVKEVPAKKEAAKKAAPAKKSAKEAPAKEKKERVLTRYTGEKKTLTVEKIIEQLKKGTCKIYRQSNPTSDGIMQLNRLKGYTDKTKEIEVIIVKL